MAATVAHKRVHPWNLPNTAITNTAMICGAWIGGCSDGSDRLCVKQYEEETQLRVFAVYDASASMNYHSRPEILRKAEFARLVLAAAGLLAQRQGDAVGLGVAGAELRDFLRARASVSHWRSFVGRLEAAAIGGQTALARSLEDLAEVIPPRSLVIVASDFLRGRRAAPDRVAAVASTTITISSACTFSIRWRSISISTRAGSSRTSKPVRA